MRRLGQVVLSVGAVMLAAGFTFPFIVGTAIPAAGYNVLQIGGIALVVIGFVMRALGKGRPKDER
jgi:hypothetical protein